MKTNQEYSMFLTGYLEALTDIDGRQREFGASVKVFQSDNSENMDDIKQQFPHLEDFTVVNRKKFRNFYSIERMLKDVLFIKAFNTDDIPKEDVDYHRDYVIFHLLDHIDFAFDDATYRLGSKKKLELIQILGEDVNRLLFVIAAEGKKMILSFYRNKKYFSDKNFIAWYDEMLKNEKQQAIKHIKKNGISVGTIHSFIFQRYNKEDIVYTAYKISLFSDVNSTSLDRICANDDMELAELIPLFEQVLNDVNLEHLKTPEDVALSYVGSAFIKVGLKREYLFSKRFDAMMEIVKEYNKKFQTQESCQKYKDNNKFGEAISSKLHEVLNHFNMVFETYQTDSEMENAFKAFYQKDDIQEVWYEIIQKIKPESYIKD